MAAWHEEHAPSAWPSPAPSGTPFSMLNRTPRAQESSQPFTVSVVSIWEYRNTKSAITRDVVTATRCVFCQEPLTTLESKSIDTSDNDRGITSGQDRCVRACPTCGWWTVHEDFMVMNGHVGAGGGGLNGAAAVLRELTVPDIHAPIELVRSYLTAKYDSRNRVHPRIFEEVVGSVFRDLGYKSRVTNYSGDDGIDVILDGPSDQLIGVQVKRYRNSISVEQIRSLAGALMLGGMTRGIFVTTSTFQSGVQRTADRLGERGCAIELMDASRFYDTLKLAQRERYRFKDESAAPYANVPLVTIESQVGII
jgi:restriction system protein